MQKAIRFAGLALLALAGCQPSRPPPIEAVATLGEVMHHMVIPNAEVVWDAVGTIYTVGKVEEIQPRTKEEWLAVEQSATVLTEAGNLLMMEGRAKDGNKWMERAKALRVAGASVHQAAKARNPAAVFERGGHLFDACQGCHFDYRFKDDANTIRSH
jgi:hypothetical protein